MDFKYNSNVVKLRNQLENVDLISKNILPLSVVVGIGVSSVAVVESRVAVSVGVGTISVGGVEEGGISLGLGLSISGP